MQHLLIYDACHDVMTSSIVSRPHIYFLEWGYVSGNHSQIDIELFKNYACKYVPDYHIHIRTLKT